MSQIEAGQLEDIDGVNVVEEDGDSVITDSTSGVHQPSSLAAPAPHTEGTAEVPPPVSTRPSIATAPASASASEGVESLVAQRSERKETGSADGSGSAAEGGGSATEGGGAEADEGKSDASPAAPASEGGVAAGDTASVTAAAKSKQEQRILEILEKPARARGGHEVQHLGEYLRLRAPKLFSDMPAEAVRTVARRATLRVARPNEVLFTQGEKGDKYYLILRGQVAIHIVTGNNGISSLNRATKEYGEHSTQHAERVEKVAARRAAARIKAERKLGGITSLLQGQGAEKDGSSGSDDSDDDSDDPAAAAEGERSRRASAIGSGMSNVEAMVANEALKYPPLMFVSGGGGKQLPPGVAREQVVVVAEALKRQEAISAAAQDDLYEKIAEQQAAAMMKRAARGLKGGSKDQKSDQDKQLSAAMALASGLRSSKLVGTIASAVTRGSMRPQDYQDSDFFQVLGRKLGYNNVHDASSPMRRPMTVPDSLLGNVVVKLPPGAGFGEIALLGAAQGMRPPPGQDELTPAQLAELEKLSRRNASAVCIGPQGFDAQLGRVVGNTEQEDEDEAEARAAAAATSDLPSSPKRGTADGQGGGEFALDAMFGAHPEDGRDKKALLRGLTYLLVIDRETYLESLTEKARQELDVKPQYLRHGMGLPLFTDWPTRRLTTIAYALKQREFPLRSPLFARGGRVRGVFFIIKGFVKVTAYAARSAPPAGLAKGLAASVKGMGNARKRVNQFALNTQRLPVDVVTLGPGSVVGDLGPLGVLPDARHTTTAVADSSTVEAFFLPQHDFLNLVMRQTDTWVAARLAAEGQRRMQGQRAIMTGLGLSPDVLQSLTPSQQQAMQRAAEGGVGGVDPYLFQYGDGNEYWETLTGVGQNRNVKFNQEQKQGDSSMPAGLAPEEATTRTAAAAAKDGKPRKQRDPLSSRIAQARKAKRLAAQAATVKAAHAKAFAKVSSLQTSGAAGTAHGAALVSEWSSKQSARRERAVARKRISDLKAEREKLRRQARQRGQALGADAGGNDDQWDDVPDTSDDSSDEGEHRGGAHADDAWLRATGSHKRPVGGSSTRFTVPVAAEGLASASYATLQGSRYGQERQTFAVTPMMALSAAGQAAKPTTMVGGSLMVSLPPSRLRSAGSLPHLIMGSATALPLPLPPPPPRGMPPPTAVDRAPMPLLEISDSMDHARAHHVSALRRLAQTTGLDGTGRQGKGALPVSARGGVGARAGAPLGGSKASLYRRAHTPPGRWVGHRTAGPLSGGMVGSFAMGANLNGVQGGMFPPGSPILSHAAIESKSPGSTPPGVQGHDASSPPRHVPDAETFAAARQEVLARAAASASDGTVVFARPIAAVPQSEHGSPQNSMQSVLSEEALAAHNVQAGGSPGSAGGGASAVGIGTQPAYMGGGPAVSFSAASISLSDRNTKKQPPRTRPVLSSPGTAGVPAVATHSAFLPRAVRETMTSVEAGHSPLGAEATINTVALSPFSKLDKGGPVRSRGGVKKPVPTLPLHGRLLTDPTSTAMSRALYYHETGGGEGGGDGRGLLALEGSSAHHHRASSARAGTAGSDMMSRAPSAASSTGVVHGVAGGVAPVVGTTRGIRPGVGRMGGSVRLGQQDAISALETALRHDAPKLGMDRYMQLGARRRAAAEQGGVAGTGMHGRGSVSAREFASTAPAGMQGSHSARGPGKSVFVSAGSRLLSKEALGTGFAGGGGLGPVAFGGRAAVHDTTRDEYEDVTWQQASGRDAPVRGMHAAVIAEGGEGGLQDESLPFAPSLVDAANANRGVGVGGGNARRMIGSGAARTRGSGPIPAWMQLMAASGHKQRVLRDITVAEAAGIERGSGDDPLITQSGVAARAVVIQREKEALRLAIAQREAAAAGSRGVSFSRASMSGGGSRGDDGGNMTPVVPSEAGGIIAAGAATRPVWEDTNRPWRQGAEIEARVHAAVAAQSKPGPRAPTSTSVRPGTSEHAKRATSSGLSGRTQELYAAVKLDGTAVTMSDDLRATAANAKAPSAPGAGAGRSGRTARVAVLRGRGRTLRVSGASSFGLPGDAASTTPAAETKAEHGTQDDAFDENAMSTLKFQTADLHSGRSFEGGVASNATPHEYANEFATRIVASAARPAWSVASLGSLGSLASRAAEEAAVKAEQAQRDEELAAIVASGKAQPGAGSATGLAVSHLGLAGRGGSPLSGSARGAGSARTLSSRGLGGSFASMPRRNSGKAVGGSAQSLFRSGSPVDRSTAGTSSAFMASMPEHAFADWTTAASQHHDEVTAQTTHDAVAGSGAEAAAQLKVQSEETNQPEQPGADIAGGVPTAASQAAEPKATTEKEHDEEAVLAAQEAQAEHKEEQSEEQAEQSEPAADAPASAVAIAPADEETPPPSPDASRAVSAELRPVTASSAASGRDASRADSPLAGEVVQTVLESNDEQSEDKPEQKDAVVEEQELPQAAEQSQAAATSADEVSATAAIEQPKRPAASRPGFVVGVPVVPPPSRARATAQLGVAPLALPAPTVAPTSDSGPPGRVPGLVLGLPAAPGSTLPGAHGTGATVGAPKRTPEQIRDLFRSAALAAVVGVGGFGAPREASPPDSNDSVLAVRQGTGIFRPERRSSLASSEYSERSVTGDSAAGAADVFGPSPPGGGTGSPTHSVRSRASRGSAGGSPSTKNRQRSRTRALHAKGNSTQFSIAEERAAAAAVPTLPPTRVNGRAVSDESQEATPPGAGFRRTGSLSGSPMMRGMGRRTLSSGGGSPASMGGPIALSPAAVHGQGAGGVSPMRAEKTSSERRGTHGDDDIFSVLSDEEGGAGGFDAEPSGGAQSPVPVVSPLRVDTGAPHSTPKPAVLDPVGGGRQ